MAIQFVNAGAEGSAASGNITLGAPASPQVGDIWIAVVHSSDQVTHSFTDWTQIAQGNGGGTTSRISVWWFRYNGSTPNLVVTHTGGQSPIGGILAFRGCLSTGDPIDVVGSITGGTDASIEIAAVTTTVANTMLVACDGSADDNNRTTIPTGFTAALEDTGAGTNNAFVTTAGTPDGSVAAFYLVQAGIGSSGALTDTQAAADPWASVLFALKPELTPDFDAASSVTGISVSSLTWAHTCSGSDRLITIFGCIGSSAAMTGSTATYNGVSATEFASADDANWNRIIGYQLIAPATGSNNVVVTFNQTHSNAVGGAISFTKVHQTTPLGTPATGANHFNTSNTVSVSSGTSEVVVGGTMTDDDIDTVVGSGGIVRFEQSVNNDNAGEGATWVGASSVTVSWTQAVNGWATVGVGVKLVGTAAPTGLVVPKNPMGHMLVR